MPTRPVRLFTNPLPCLSSLGSARLNQRGQSPIACAAEYGVAFQAPIRDLDYALALIAVAARVQHLKRKDERTSGKTN